MMLRSSLTNPGWQRIASLPVPKASSSFLAGLKMPLPRISGVGGKLMVSGGAEIPNCHRPGILRVTTNEPVSNLLAIQFRQSDLLPIRIQFFVYLLEGVLPLSLHHDIMLSRPETTVDPESLLVRQFAIAVNPLSGEEKIRK